MMKNKAKKQNLPVSFIVRIYRFHGERPEGMVGMVETVGVEGEKGFAGIEELWAILNGCGSFSGETRDK